MGHEKLVRDSNFLHANENSNISESPTENPLDFLTLSAPISNLKRATVTNDPTFNDLHYNIGNLPDTSIVWSNPKLFVKPIHVAKFQFGINFQDYCS